MWAILITTLLLTTGLPSTSHAEPNTSKGSFLLFPSVHSDRRSALRTNSPHKKNDSEPAIDLFYTKEFKRFRFLTEVFYSDNEAEVERLLFGWLLRPESTLSFGRYHSPLGYWNTQYHHGVHLQTSVHRPGIIEYEDAGGILPTHVSGLLFTSGHRAGKSKLEYTVSVGVGPELTINGLEPFNVLDPKEGSHKSSIAFKLVYRPDEFGTNEHGLFVGKNNITSALINISKIEQTVFGLYSRLQIKRTTITTALYYVNNNVDTTTSNKENSFISGYTQAEAPLARKWLLYGRLEGTKHDDNDVYLQLFPDFHEGRNLIGTRFDFVKNQAITIEASIVRRNGKNHNHLSLQWSAVFP